MVAAGTAPPIPLIYDACTRSSLRAAKMIGVVDASGRVEVPLVEFGVMETLFILLMVVVDYIHIP